MKLLYAPPSPFARKVVALMHETGQMDDIDLLDVRTAPVATAPEVAAANPVGKIPALVLDDGSAIYDSRVICRYLDDRASAGLYPADNIWKTLTLESTADGVLDAAVLITYEGRIRPEEMQMFVWTDAQWAKIARVLDVLESDWMDHLNGPLDMGVLAVGCALGYLDFRHDARNWRDGHHTLAAWYAEFEKRPSMQATIPTD